MLFLLKSCLATHKMGYIKIMAVAVWGKIAVNYSCKLFSPTGEAHHTFSTKLLLYSDNCVLPFLQVQTIVVPLKTGMQDLHCGLELSQECLLFREQATNFRVFYFCHRKISHIHFLVLTQHNKCLNLLADKYTYFTTAVPFEL